MKNSVASVASEEKMRVLGPSMAALGSSSEGTGRSMIHDPLVEGSRGSAGKSTIHDPLVEGSRGFLKTSTIHEGVTLYKGGGATK